MRSQVRRVIQAAVCIVLGGGPLAAQIPSSEYGARRDSLAARIGNGVVVAFGERNPVSDFGPFYQLPAFHYLTGYDEPDAALVLVARNGKSESTLYITPSNPRLAFYYGFRPDSAAVAAQLGVSARSFGALSPVLDSLAGSGLPLYTLADFEDADFARQDSLTRGRAFVAALVARHVGLEVRDAHPIVNELRARKSAAELALIRRAAAISAAGHRAAMTAPQPEHEYELAAALEGTFKRLGGERPAYGSIVGSGLNGTQLHYMQDRGATKPGDVVVMDAATQFEGYAADITRSIPVSGTFTPAQRAIYELVLESQKAAERNARVGLPEQAAEDSSQDVRARGLAKLGLVEGEDASFDPPWPADCQARPRNCRQAMLWMIHGISHGLGLAVHDPAQFNFGDRTYRSGDVFTLEPGLYISTRSLDALPQTPRNQQFIAKVRAAVERYQNTGVRIEDDYVVAPTGLERITSDAPREIRDIEALMKRRPSRVMSAIPASRDNPPAAVRASAATPVRARADTPGQ